MKKYHLFTTKNISMINTGISGDKKEGSRLKKKKKKKIKKSGQRLLVCILMLPSKPS